MALTCLSFPQKSVSLDANPSPFPQQGAALLSVPQHASHVRPVTTGQQNLYLDTTFSSSPKEGAYSISYLPEPITMETGPSCGPIKTAFDALESALQTPIKTKYRRRMNEKYDLSGSPTYEVWKKLFTGSITSGEDHSGVFSGTQLSPSTQDGQQLHHASPSLMPLFDTQNIQCYPLQSSSEVSPVLQEILTFPSASENNQGKRKTAKRSLPNFLNSEDSMRIMLDEKLKKAREVAEKQKKLREREEKKAAKLKEQEEKKKKIEERKRQREKAAKTKAAKKRKSVHRNKGRIWRQQLHNECSEVSENICKVCLQEYDKSDDENIPWVMCDKCKLWMHIDCVPLGVDTTPIDDGRQFLCHDCV